MQINWSLVLNVLLLIGVIIVIGRMMKARRQNINAVKYQPSVGQPMNTNHHDDIIAVRKINRELVNEKPVIQPAVQAVTQPIIQATVQPTIQANKHEPIVSTVSPFQEDVSPVLGSERVYRPFLLQGCVSVKGIYFIDINHPMDRAPCCVVWLQQRQAVFLICKT